MKSNITIEKAKELLTKECKDVLQLPQLIETLHQLSFETCELGNALEEKTLGNYSYYEGQLKGLEMALYLIDRLPKALKRPLTLCHDEIEYDTEPEAFEYYCTACGHNDIFEDHIYCPYCGGLFLNEGEKE